MAAASTSFLPAILAFGGVVALIPIALALFKRLRQSAGNPQSSLQLVANLNLGPRERICIVRVGQQQIIVGVTAHTISALSGAVSDCTTGMDAQAAGQTASPAASPAAVPGMSKSGSFAKVLDAVRQQLHGRSSALIVVGLLGLMHAPDSLAQVAAGTSQSARSAPATATAAKSTLTQPASATDATLSVNSTPVTGGGTNYSVPIQTLLVFTALSFLPAILLLMTSFTRIIIVLSLLRQAIGLQTTPPNQVLVGMALFLTFFVMGPTLDRVYAQAYKPYSEQKISFDQALESGSEPLRTFMLKQTRESDLSLFVRIAKADVDLTPATMPMRILIPAFVTSELKTAFQIGFLVFVPFLIIDLIVASVLMSMGMMMLSPVLIALPFKLMLFVLADGWNLLMSSMVASFGSP